MSILVYLLVPLLIVLAASMVMWARNRQPTSLQSGVDDFRREMQALSPETQRTSRQRPAHPEAPPQQPAPPQPAAPLEQPAPQHQGRSPRTPGSASGPGPQAGTG